MTFKEIREKLEREYPDMGWDEVDKMAAEMSADYIKRSDAIIAIFDKLIDGSNASYSAKWFNTGMRTAMSVLDTLRGEDVVPVRHGRWLSMDSEEVIAMDNDGCPVYSCRCSECRDWLTASDEYSVRGRYCPNCGARMDGDGE